MTMPPHIATDDKVVLFDGECKLCNGWVQFLLKHDTRPVFTLCMVQSPEGQDILRWFGLPTDHFHTMLYVHGDQLWIKSSAALAIVAQLPRPWCYLGGLRWLPRQLRDWCYDRIALNRYRLFGRYPHCQLPSEQHQSRFLGTKTRT